MSVEAIKLFEKWWPEVILEELNKILISQVFSNEWEVARVVLLPKNDRSM